MKKNVSNRSRALLLLAILVSDLARPYMLKASGSTAPLQKDGPVAAAASNYVDLFTGDFHYSVPLMVVPGPHGEAVDISANYHGGGIKMDEPASWIGLGWDYNPGEISRSIIGTHDDNKGYPMPSLHAETNTVVAAGSGSGEVTTRENFVFGPLYYNTSSTQSSYFSSYLYLGTAAASKANDIFNSAMALPGYDNYAVSGPGIGGKIKPYILSSLKLYGPLPTTSTISIQCGYTRPEFNFENSSDVSNSDFNTSTLRFPNGYYVKYYKNSEINDTSKLYSSYHKDGFLDYRTPPTSTRRPSSAGSSPYETAFDPDGIGGFKITDPTGISYHYSLPVYSQEEYFYSFDLSYSGSTPSLAGNIDLVKKPYKYATSWKLTAITGPDYADANNDHVVNPGDKGYWVSYNYSLWCNEFLWASSQFNYTRDLRINSFEPQTYGYAYQGASAPKYIPRFSMCKGKRQVYYLNTIQTSTHTAFFIKEIRSDEHSYDKIQNSSNSPVPLLKLDKIALLRNEDASLFSNAGTLPSVSGLSTSSCNPNSDLVHIGKYTTNQAQIDLKSLKSVDFNTDYSLCQKYHKNINNSFTVSRLGFVSGGSGNTYNDVVSVNNGSDLVFAYYTANTWASDLTTSGKLTLNEITTYENGRSQVFPTYQFEYVNNNYYYNNLAVDFWGCLKSDFDPALPSSYTTSSSATNLKEWSLKKITTPLGGTIDINYQPDSYEREARGYISEIPIPFMISNVTEAPATYTQTVGKIFSNFTLPQGNDFIAYAGSNAVDLVMPLNTRCSGDALTSGGQQIWIRDHYIQKNIQCALVFGSYTNGVLPANVGHSGSTYYYNCTNFNTSPPPYLVSGKNSCSTVYADYLGGTGYFNVHCSYLDGGGTRVSSVVITDPQSAQSYTTTYEYSDSYCRTQPLPFNFKVNPVSQQDYDLYYKFTTNDAYGMGPMVSYGQVTVKTLSNNSQNNGSIVYKFSNMQESPGFTYNHGSGYSTLSDNRDFERYGKPVRTEVYDKNGALVGYTNNTYTVGNKISELGMVHQTSFLSATETYKDGVLSKMIINSRDKGTAQPTSITNIDPTQGAITKNTELAYTTTTYTTMGLKNVNTAYQNNAAAVSKVKIIKRPLGKNSYGDMLYDPDDDGKLIGGIKNTFTQSVPYRTYNSSGGHFETGTQTKDFWMPDESYELVVDNNTAGNTADGSLTWRKTSEATSYNANTQGLQEAQGLNGRYASAVKMGYNNQYKIADLSDANLDCFSFSSFEDGTLTGNTTSFYGGEISGASMQVRSPQVHFTLSGLSVTPVAVFSHTGDYMAMVPASSYGPTFSTINFDKGRTYRASVWVNTLSGSTYQLAASLDGTINGSAQTISVSTTYNNANNVTVGDWKLLQLDITVPATYTATSGPLGQNDLRFFVQNTGSSEIYVDDFSIHPVDAAIDGYVYNAATGWLTATLDNENFATRYIYDAAGRVVKVEKETKDGFKKITETSYHFGR